MHASRSLWLLLPRRVRALPADLAVMVVFVVVTNVAVLAPVIRDTPLRVPLGLVFVLFVPGYAFVAALFPEAGESPTAADGDETGMARTGIDGIERVALSFGLSIAIVPLLGLVLNFTPWGIRLTPIMIAVSGFVLVAVVVGAYRRQQLPEDEQFAVPYRQWYAQGRAELVEADSRADVVLNVLLVASILLAVSSVGYAVMFPPDGEQFTEFYLLTEDEEGELVAANYPSEFELGESQPVVVGIGNQEHSVEEYTVVVQLQDVEGEGNETVVRERQEIDRFTSPPLADNETWQQERAIEPTITGEQLRLQYLLYREAPPAAPTRANAYRDLHLWINVTAETGANAG